MIACYVQNCARMNITVRPNILLQPNLLSRPNRILVQALAKPVEELDVWNEEDVEDNEEEELV